VNRLVRYGPVNPPRYWLWQTDGFLAYLPSTRGSVACPGELNLPARPTWRAVDRVSTREATSSGKTLVDCGGKENPTLYVDPTTPTIRLSYSSVPSCRSIGLVDLSVGGVGLKAVGTDGPDVLPDYNWSKWFTLYGAARRGDVSTMSSQLILRRRSDRERERVSCWAPRRLVAIIVRLRNTVKKGSLYHHLAVRRKVLVLRRGQSDGVRSFSMSLIMSAPYKTASTPARPCIQRSAATITRRSVRLLTVDAVAAWSAIGTQDRRRAALNVPPGVTCVSDSDLLAPRRFKIEISRARSLRAAPRTDRTTGRPVCRPQKRVQLGGQLG